MKVSQIYSVSVSNTDKTGFRLPDESIQKFTDTVADMDVSVNLKDAIKQAYSNFIGKYYVYVSNKPEPDSIVFRIYNGMDSKESVIVELKRKNRI